MLFRSEILPPAPVAVVHLAPPKPVAIARLALSSRAAPALRAASYAPQRLQLRRALLARPLGGSINSVVQIAAYGNRVYVAGGWNNLSRRFASLRAYTPVVARFNAPQGQVYRLSVKGFASAKDATGLCQSLKRAGANCFVRTVAGDAPVRIASR